MLDNKITTFLEVCKYKNLTKAAESLFITQPAVTQQMKALEEYYECKLFSYSGKKLLLTKQGEELYHYALAMTVNQKRIKEIVQLGGSRKKQLNFGATLTLGEYVMPPLLTKYLKMYPDTDLLMKVDNTVNLLEQLKSGSIDFALIEGYYEKDEYDVTSLFEDTFIGVCSPNHKFANKTVALADLFGERLIIREIGSGTREVLERALSLYNCSIQDWCHIAQIGNMSAIKEMVENDMGITFMHEAAVSKERKNGSLVKIHIKDFDVKKDYTAVSLKESTLQKQRDQFLQFIHDVHK